MPLFWKQGSTYTLAPNERDYTVDCGDCGGKIAYIVGLASGAYPDGRHSGEIYVEYVLVRDVTCTCSDAPRVDSKHEDAALTPEEEERIGEEYLWDWKRG